MGLGMSPRKVIVIVEVIIVQKNSNDSSNKNSK